MVSSRFQRVWHQLPVALSRVRNNKVFQHCNEYCAESCAVLRGRRFVATSVTRRKRQRPGIAKNDDNNETNKTTNTPNMQPPNSQLQNCVISVFFHIEIYAADTCKPHDHPETVEMKAETAAVTQFQVSWSPVPCLICEWCRLTVVWVDCGCSVYCCASAILPGARSSWC